MAGRSPTAPGRHERRVVGGPRVLRAKAYGGDWPYLPGRLVIGNGLDRVIHDENTQDFGMTRERAL